MTLGSIFSKIITVSAFIIILAAIVLYGRGYRPNLTGQKLDSTGIIVASSAPDGAKIYINDQLYGATNENINLAPGNYHVKIEKEGFSSWQKDITLKGEWAVKANAVLYPLNPSLSPITSLGIVKAIASESGEKTICITQTGDDKKDGLYLLQNTKRTLSIGSQIKPLALKASFPQNTDLSTAEILISPDEQEMLVTIFKEEVITKKVTSKKITPTPTLIAGKTYLISLTEEKQTPFDVTNSVDSIKSVWAKEKMQVIDKLIKTLKQPLQKIATDSFTIVSISPDGKKILYKAKTDANIPEMISPLPGSNQSPQSRSIKKGMIYVYDKEEDKNFAITSAPATGDDNMISHMIFWHPNSQNIIINEGTTVSVVDYDNMNKRTIYSGPFELSYLAISDQGDLLVLANLNPKINAFPDIYSVGIR